VRISKLKLIILLVMSAIGVWASSTVLVIFYSLNQQLPLCPTGTYNVFGYNIRLDCGAVLSSSYSKVFGVPLELLALVYFLVNITMVFVIAFGSDRAARRTVTLLFAWRFLGVALVPYLIFIELFLLHAICVYCTIMHAAILIDFAVISYLLFFGKNSLWKDEDELVVDSLGEETGAGGSALSAAYHAESIPPSQRNRQSPGTEKFIRAMNLSVERLLETELGGSPRELGRATR